MYAGCHLSQLFAVLSAVVSLHCIYAICVLHTSALISLSLQVLPDLYLGNFKGVSKCYFLLNHSDFLHMTAHILSLSINLSFCLRFLRCERPRTVSQKQHHAHPVHPRQRGSHPPGETPSISSYMVTSPHTSPISHQFFKESDEARGPNRSDWLSPDPLPSLLVSVHMTGALTQSHEPVCQVCSGRKLRLEQTQLSPQWINNKQGSFSSSLMWSLGEWNASQQQLVRSVCRVV